MQRIGWFVFAAALAACTGMDDQPDPGNPRYTGPGGDGTTDGSGGDGSGDGGDNGGSGEGDGGGDGDDDAGGGSDDGGSGGTGGGGASSPGVKVQTGCAAYDSSVYTPFVSYGPVSTGPVATYSWRGPSTYPEAIEDFRAYSTLPSAVECGGARGTRDHLDVTVGCLNVVSLEGDKRGQIESQGAGQIYRSFALPYDAANQRQVAWTDQGVEYRFKYDAWTGTQNYPGFKAFVRYMTEYDLYVASWRMDGTVQIQKKQCGTYTFLNRNSNYGAPTPGVWHTIRFEIVGTEMRLYLDGKLAMTASDSSIPHGTAGIRTDATNGAFIDDWRVYAP